MTKVLDPQHLLLRKIRPWFGLRPNFGIRQSLSEGWPQPCTPLGASAPRSQLLHFRYRVKPLIAVAAEYTHLRHALISSATVKLRYSYLVRDTPAHNVAADLVLCSFWARQN